MARSSRTNGLQSKRDKEGRSRSAELVGIPSDSFPRMWARMDSLYDDCVMETIDVARASALSRIAGRQIMLLGMAIQFQKRVSLEKRLLPSGKLPLVAK